MEIPFELSSDRVPTRLGQVRGIRHALEPVDVGGEVVVRSDGGLGLHLPIPRAVHEVSLIEDQSRQLLEGALERQLRLGGGDSGNVSGHRRPERHGRVAGCGQFVGEHADDARRPLILGADRICGRDVVRPVCRDGDGDGPGMDRIREQRAHEHDRIAVFDPIDDEGCEALPEEGRLVSHDDLDPDVGARNGARVDLGAGPVDPGGAVVTADHARARRLEVVELLAADHPRASEPHLRDEVLRESRRGFRSVVPPLEADDDEAGARGRQVVHAPTVRARGPLGRVV